MGLLGRWLRTAGMRGWQLAGVAVAVWVLWTLYQQLRLLVVTIFVAFLITALLTPVARWLEDRGMPRTPATVVTVLGAVLLAAAVTAALGYRVAQQLADFADQFDTVRSSLIETLQQTPLEVPAARIAQPLDQAMTYLRDHAMAVLSGAFALITLLGLLATAAIIAFFLIRDGDRINQWLLDHLVDPEQRELVSRVGARAGDTLQGYIQAVVIIGAFDGLFIGAALLFMGVPLAIPLGILTFIGGFFPVVGATVAGLLAALVALVTGGPVQALIVVGVTIAVQQIDGNVLQPVIMGNAVNLHPVVVLLALTAGGMLDGIVGAFLAVPLFAVMTSAAREYFEVGVSEGQLEPDADDSDDG